LELRVLIENEFVAEKKKCGAVKGKEFVNLPSVWPLLISQAALSSLCSVVNHGLSFCHLPAAPDTR